MDNVLKIASSGRSWIGGLVLMAAMAVSSMAWADDDEPFRVVIMELEDGGEEQIEASLSEISNLDIRSYDWFVEQVESRAFQVAGITDSPSDLVWVMDGGNIDLIIDFEEESTEDFSVRFIIADGGSAEREFLADRGHNGGIRRGGATVIRFELEDYLDLRPQIVAEPVVVEPPADSQQESRGEFDDSDPEAMRQRAAREREELKERLSRDWLWIRAHGRYFQKDLSVAAEEAIFTYRSGGFFGFELDIEAFPMGWTNPERVDTGFYATYNHGFYGLTLIDESGDEAQTQNISVHNLTMEGGALYRLDSPLDDSNRQLRFKIGARYENFSVTDNPEIPGNSMIAFVMGTRLLLPVLIDEFAVSASLDVVPFGTYLSGTDVFGADSFSYGFGSELGIVYEVMNNGFLSVGYSFRLMRSDFSGDGEPIGEDDEENPLVFSESDSFDLNQGLRAGFIYQY